MHLHTLIHKTHKNLFIDSFPVTKITADSLCLLSHDHTDAVGHISKKTKTKIYTSAIVARMLDNPHVEGKFKQQKWYRIQNRNVYVFPTLHCCGSVGFFVDGLLFLGDGRVTPSIEQIARTLPFRSLAVDTLYYDVPYSLPTVDESFAIFDELVLGLGAPVRVTGMHTGALYLVCKHLMESTFPCQFDFCGMTRSDATPRVVVLNDVKADVDVQLSSGYFIHNGYNVWEPHYCEEKNRYKVFLSCHASRDEVLQVLMLADPDTQLFGTSRP